MNTFATPIVVISNIFLTKVIHLTSTGSPEEKLRVVFRMYDKDGNGSIDKREMNEWGIIWILVEWTVLNEEKYNISHVFVNDMATN